MAMTLAQADVLSLPDAKRGVIETIIEEGGGFIERLPFESVVGTYLTYVRELTLPTIDFYSVNEDIPESSPTHVPVTAYLKQMGGNGYLANFLRRTKGNIANLEAEYIRTLVKATTRKFLDTAIYGNATTNTKSFNGLHALMDSNQCVHASAGLNTTGAAMSLAKLDELIDKIKPGKPDCLFINKNMRRRFAQAIRSTTVAGNLNYGIDQFGKRVGFWDEIPLIVTDWILQTEGIASGTYDAKDTDVTTSIFAVKYGDVASGGLAGMQGSEMAEIERKVAEKKDSAIFLVKWYTAMALGNIYSLARYDGITDAAITA